MVPTPQYVYAFGWFGDDADMEIMCFTVDYSICIAITASAEYYCADHISSHLMGALNLCD
jgi:hypothetical protein